MLNGNVCEGWQFDQQHPGRPGLLKGNVREVKAEHSEQQ
jgi:hypothetical protein